MQENDYTLYDYIKPILTGSIISIFSAGIFLFIFALVMTLNGWKLISKAE